MTSIINVKDVSKAYRLNNVNAFSLRHDLKRLIFQFGKHKQNHNEDNTFNALQNINFSIDAGERVGIIGRNGAGKTTLIRLLSGIMRPTSGQVTIIGHYVSLISLGAGFIPTLSGYDNIYLNAAFCGMNRTEIDGIVDGVIEFADIGEFIYSPIKDYSSGMKARLGFSIAIHVLPDIIMLDEVFSVGDIAFKEKSQERIFQLNVEGKTIILASHNLKSIRDMCNRAIWLHKGELVMDDNVESVISDYEKFFAKHKKDKTNG
jgi:ABC-type polysaccharide/polyol phosphate transport system ATPase subunit